MSVLIPKCTWRTVTFDIGTDDKVIKASIVWTSHSFTNCAKTCDATSVGACDVDQLCPQTSPDPA